MTQDAVHGQAKRIMYIAEEGAKTRKGIVTMKVRTTGTSINTGYGPQGYRRIVVRELEDLGIPISTILSC